MKQNTDYLLDAAFKSVIDSCRQNQNASEKLIEKIDRSNGQIKRALCYSAGCSSAVRSISEASDKGFKNG